MRQETVQQVDAGSGLTTQIMHDARIFCLQLMRVQGLETWQRLALLGVFCEKLTGCLARRDQAAVPALMDEFAGLVESGAVIDALRDLQANHEAQALVFATLWSHKEAPARTERQRAVVAAVATNLGADAETGVARIEDLVAAYAQGVKRLPQALEAAPHLLDHYLLNEMFMHMFPFEGGGDPYHSYLQLVSRYGLLRLMLAAQCVGDGPLPDADTLVTTVQVYCRRFRHDVHFAQRVNHALRNGGWESLDKLYSFLRH